MRPTWSVRLLRAFVALWFALSGGELGGMHACPMHDGDMSAAVGDAHARHGLAQPGTAHDMGGGSHEAGQGCSCVGDCCAAPAVPSVAVSPSVEVPDLLVATLASLPEADVVPTPRPAHELPFAIGPPAAATTA